MTKYSFTIALLITIIFGSCGQKKLNTTHKANLDMSTNKKLEFPDDITPIEKPENAWKHELGDFRYNVMREKGTERAFTGKYWNNHAHGVYVCAACNLPLFSSETKYESGSGWPSFYAPIENKYVQSKEDNSHFMHRVEVLCPRCGGHLGHVFNDGPQPTGKRYCINSISLDFIPTEQTSDKK